MQATTHDLALGEHVLRTGSLSALGDFFEAVRPRLLKTIPTSPDDFRLLAMASVLAPYLGAAVVEDVRRCAESGLDIPDSPRDRMFVSVALGIPSGKYIEESLQLPAPYDWFAATQWCRHCHRKRVLQMFDIVYPVVMAGPGAEIEADVAYEQELATAMRDDLLLRKGHSTARINLSELLLTFPPEENESLRFFRRMETARILGLEPHSRRRGRVK